MLVLPVIDLNLKDGETRNELRKTLLDALTKSGFFYLKGFPNYDAEELLSLSKWFFSLPNDVKFSVTKKMFNKNSTHYYRGYFPVQLNETSYKEGFEVGQFNEKKRSEIASKEQMILEEDNQWPKNENHEESAKFEERMKFYHKLFTEASLELLKLLSEAWGMNSDALIPFFTPDHLSTFRLLHYPPRRGEIPKQAIDGKQVLHCSEHKDSGFITLVSTLGYEGLQIRDMNDEWVDVPNIDGCVVVNIGELFATISEGVLKATNHRVVDKGIDRYSCPFFLEPRFETNVNIKLPTITKYNASNCPKPIENKEMNPTQYGVWLIKRMRSLYAEFRYLLSDD